MLTHLIILLSESSVSYCRMNNSKIDESLMPLETLKATILFGLKENLSFQFVYPKTVLPNDYIKVINSVNGVKVKPCYAENLEDADIIVCDSATELKDFKEFSYDKIMVLRTKYKDFIREANNIGDFLVDVTRLNVYLTDVENFHENDCEEYKKSLQLISNKIIKAYKIGQKPQFNLLTDRIQLSSMNNCNAGIKNITIAPNGKFYICPAFYYSNNENSCGDLKLGLDIKNKQLLKLEKSPICRICDAYHCSRCIWLNAHLTWDINTPSRQQCIISHTERNASRELLINLQKLNILEEKETIEEIQYLDPFDLIRYKI